MYRPNLEDLRHDARIVIRVETRDTVKRLSAGTIILAVCLWAGAYVTVAITVALILITETVLSLLYRRLPERDDDIGAGFLAVLWINNLVSAAFYLIPALALARQDSVALMLGGFLWICGTFVHITYTFAFLPYFNSPMTLVAYGMSFAVLVIAGRTDVAPSSLADWLIVAGLLIVYMFNTFETLDKQRDTHRALREARREANIRLRQLEKLARTDALTGLLTRRAFDERLERMLSQRREGDHTAVIVIDLDGFKPINDSYSHEAGDHVLIVMAERLRHLAGDRGIAARFGGDEFALGFPALPSSHAALRFGIQVAKTLSEPIPYASKDLHIAASVGISLTGQGADTVSGLCAAADQAMYRAKAEQGGHAVLYDPREFHPRATLEDRQALADAMARGEIAPHYQPKVNLVTGRLSGFEALARWTHPERGLLTPADFLPQIIELGLQGALVSHMTERILGDVEALLAEGLDPGQVSINIPELALATHSGRAELEALLSAHPDARGHITLEITEDVFIARAAEMVQNSVARLRTFGVRISLDDFGTGFASFQHLRQLEFDEMKIDTSFVEGLGRDPTAEVLVKAFLYIARGLGVAVIAEGVETAAQEAELRSLGCSYAQGFRYGRALPLDDIRLRLRLQAHIQALEAERQTIV